MLLVWKRRTGVRATAYVRARPDGALGKAARDHDCPRVRRKSNLARAKADLLVLDVLHEMS
jgi:hypothetical protein